MGKVYKVVNDIDTDFYVGSTTLQYLCDRLCGHRQTSKNDTTRRQSPLYQKIRAIGSDHFRIELIEEYPCESKKELLVREQYWIDLLKPTLNKFKAIEQRTPEQYYKDIYQKEKEYRLAYCKEYYQRNAEQIKARVRAYAESNKELIAEQTKKYRETHREELKAKKSAIIECPCGGKTTASHYGRHKKGKPHKAWEERNTQDEKTEAGL